MTSVTGFTTLLDEEWESLDRTDAAEIIVNRQADASDPPVRHRPRSPGTRHSGVSRLVEQEPSELSTLLLKQEVPSGANFTEASPSIPSSTPTFGCRPMPRD